MSALVPRRDDLESLEGYHSPQVPAAVRLAVSYSGGMFQLRALLLEPLAALLCEPTRNYELRSATLPPHAGAALYAARLAGVTLPPQSLDALKANTNAAD